MGKNKKKRKHFHDDEYEHYDDKYGMKRQQMLPVYDVDQAREQGHEDTNENDDDMQEPPIDGYAYIRRVQRQASRIADIVHAQLPPDMNLYATNAFKATTNAASSSCSPDMKPSKDWTDKFIIDFTNFREGLAVNLSDKPSLKLPSIGQEQYWYKFCYGKSNDNDETSTSGNVKEDDKDNDNEDDVEDKTAAAQTNGATSSSLLYVTEGYAPSLSILANMNHKTTWKLIDYHIKWLDVDDDELEDVDVADLFDARMGIWLFALLAKVDTVMMANQTSTLRELGKKCILIRYVLARRISKQKQTNVVTKNDGDDVVADSQIGVLNMVITIIGKFFGQLDLLD